MNIHGAESAWDRTVKIKSKEGQEMPYTPSTALNLKDQEIKKVTHFWLAKDNPKHSWKIYSWISLNMIKYLDFSLTKEILKKVLDKISTTTIFCWYSAEILLICSKYKNIWLISKPM